MGIIKLKNKAVHSHEEQVEFKKEVLPVEEITEEEEMLVCEPGILAEDERKKTENSRHYIMNNNTVKSVYSSEPENYYNEEKQVWEAAVSGLEEKEGNYEGRIGKYTARFQKPKYGREVKLGKDNINISWEYLGKVPTKAQVSQGGLKLQKKDKKGKKSYIGQAIYEDVEKDTDLEYLLEGGKLKENIIVRGRGEEYRYYFKLKAENLKLKLSEDNMNLEFYSETNQEEKLEFTIPSPYMYDAAGARSDEVYYELEPNEEGGYIFAVVAETEWINVEGRVFPVTIDPQIVTTPIRTFIDYQVEECTCRIAGENQWSNVYKNSLLVVDQDSYAYRTRLKIKKSNISLMKNQIIKVKLLLTVSKPINGRFKIAGKEYDADSTTYARNYVLEVDITQDFNTENGDFYLYIEPQGMVDGSFTTNPALEIEYLNREGVRPTKKSYALAGFASAEVDLSTGEAIYEIPAVSASNSVMGLTVAHIYKQTQEESLYGKNLHLNLEEHLEEYTASDKGINYIYTDGKGNKHGFKEYFYTIKSLNERDYISKEEVTVEADGDLIHDGKRVYREYRSNTGWNMTARLNGINGLEVYEQREEQEKQLAEQIESYKTSLLDMLRINETCTAKRSFKELTKKGYDQFLCTLADDAMILPRNLAHTYSSLYQQLKMLELQDKSYETQLESLTGQKNSALECYISADNDNWNGQPIQLVGFGQTKESLELQDGTFDYQFDQLELYLDELALEIQTIPTECQTFENNEYRLLENMRISANEYGNNLAAQRELLQSQITLASQQDTLAESDYNKNLALLQKQIENTNELAQHNLEQKALYEEQLNEIRQQRQYYLDQFEKLMMEYLRAEEQMKNLKQQLPVYYLNNGSIVKGYNEMGQLVCIYDQYGNCAAFEYEIYDFIHNKNRLARIYDKTGKEVVFTYNGEDKLTSITDVKGQRTVYDYDEQGYLSQVVYATGEVLEFENLNNRLTKITEQKYALQSNLCYSNHRLSTIENVSLAVRITKNEITRVDLSLPNISFNYTLNGSNMQQVIITQDLIRNKYLFDENGNLSAHYEEESGVVTKAEQYEYVPYTVEDATQVDMHEHIVYSKRSTLFKFPFGSYNFEAGDSVYTKLNKFNQPEKSTTSWVDLDANGTNQQRIVTDYFYDEEQRLVEEIACIKTTNPSKEYTTHKKYYRNAKGSIIRTESWVAGEEHTVGKSISETEYDEMGNTKKSYTYNSLDSGSKYYMENEYSTDGSLIASYDATGEYKIQYNYNANTNMEMGKLLPNGSKFAYGRELDGTVTEITQSTEDGEENSTKTYYTCGVATEARSGNNVIEYSYDYKRRVQTVNFNGINNYVQYEYIEDMSSEGTRIQDRICATYVPSSENSESDVFETTKDLNGNVLSLSINNILQYQKTYKNNLLETVRDMVTGAAYRYERDTHDCITAIYTMDDDGSEKEDVYGEVYDYDTYGALYRKRIVGDVAHEYTYQYNADSTRKLASMSVNGITIIPQTDVLNRATGKKVMIGASVIAEESKTYRKIGDHTTDMIATIRYGDTSTGSYIFRDSLKYAYDVMGNISKVYENGKLTVSYTYDNLNRLVREDNKLFGKTWLYTYDNNGNILLKEEYEYCIKEVKELADALVSSEYCYKANSDQLLRIIKREMAENGTYNETVKEISYDNTIGNPLFYRGKNLTWQMGRRLVAYGECQFEYDGFGKRIKLTAPNKDDEDKTHTVEYLYDRAGRLIKQSNGLEFFYDHTGVMGLEYEEKYYFYRKDSQQNIVAILDNSGKVVVRYTYDSWGNHDITVLDSSCEQLANLNPFRYRSYYYDTDTDLYFLKTRYYDPEIGRFISIDGISYLNPNAINGLNLYAYCKNNPAMYIDSNGTDAILITAYGKEGLFIFGHSALLIQDENNKWYLTEFTARPRDGGKPGARVYVEEMPEEYNNVYDFIESHYGAPVDAEEMIHFTGYTSLYLKGEYEESLKAAREIKAEGMGNAYNGKYNLFFNNCLHYVQDILMCGTSDVGLIQLVHHLPSGLIPALFSWTLSQAQGEGAHGKISAAVTALLSPLGLGLRAIVGGITRIFKED